MKKNYSTEQKALIEKFLSDGKDYTCAEIVDGLKSIGTPVSMPTVYRHLSKLRQSGVLNSFFIDGKYRYVSARDNKDMAHLKCVDCGSTFVLDCHDLACFKEHVNEHHHFKMDSSSIVFYGKCEHCAQTEEEKDNQNSNKKE